MGAPKRIIYNGPREYGPASNLASKAPPDDAHRTLYAHAGNDTLEDGECLFLKVVFRGP
jgi:hypothetical protein